MSRHKFLGSTDLGIVESLLKSYNVPTKIPNCDKLHKIKQQDDMILLELGTLLTPNECDEIISTINNKHFEEMSKKYDDQNRNNSRLIVIDDRFARTLWRRLKFNNKIHQLIMNKKPLGFNVQGEWTMCGVNSAMRINKYKQDQIFSPHKDAQYAPNGDKRSLLSLIIYLNDDYENGETIFYFPKVEPKSDIKGLTIKEEIEAFDGLENGYESIKIKPKKGYAILFSHNLLHEAAGAQMKNCTERIILRSDVLVERKDRPLGFAVCREEEDDYLACLNYFRQAQINELECEKKSEKLISIGELYERSLSIRYSYPRLLEKKLNQSMNIDSQQISLLKKLPNETWLYIFKYLNGQDIQNFIFAYPEFHPLKISWQIQETKQLENDSSKEKFIPRIHTQYGSQTVFQFSDPTFFFEHVYQCCRVAAVYAFILLGHARDSKTYTVQYNRYTQEVCEVEIDKLLSDAFYNRNCYGSIYHVKEKNGKEHIAKDDFDYSVDRTYMMNRHQSQFIGQDLLSRFHCNVISVSGRYSETGGYEDYDDDDDDDEVNDSHNSDSSKTISNENAERIKVINAIARKQESLVKLNDNYGGSRKKCLKSDTMAYREQLINPMNENSGVSVSRMLSGENVTLCGICVNCCDGGYTKHELKRLMCCYNHLVFDFDTHQLSVEQLTDETENIDNVSRLFTRCLKQLKQSISKNSFISYYRVNIEKLAEQTKGFNHAACQCVYPVMTINQFSFFDYTYLSHVYLAVAKQNDDVLVLATYNGTSAF